MAELRPFLVAISKRIPEALVVAHSSERGLRFQRGNKVTTLPEFQVCRGFILGEEGAPPIQTPPLTEEAELDANVTAVVLYHSSLTKSAIKQGMQTPLRTLISVNERSEPDRYTLAVWVYR